MFLFVLLTLINSHLINTTARNYSFRSLHYGNLCSNINLWHCSFLSAWVMGADRIPGAWQINIFHIEVSNR